MFLILQAVSTLEELSSTYGSVGTNTGVNLGEAFVALIGYIWQPGRTLEEFATDKDKTHMKLEQGVEFLMRLDRRVPRVPGQGR